MRMNDKGIRSSWRLLRENGGLGLAAISYVSVDYLRYLSPSWHERLQPALWIALSLAAVTRVPFYRNWTAELRAALPFLASIIIMLSALLFEALSVRFSTAVLGLDWHVSASPLPDTGQWLLLSLNEKLPRLVVDILRAHIVGLHHFLMLFIMLGFSVLFNSIRAPGLGLAARYMFTMAIGRLLRAITFVSTILPSVRPWCASSRFSVPAHPHPWAQKYYVPYASDSNTIRMLIQSDIHFATVKDYPAEYRPDWGKMSFLIDILRPNVADGSTWYQLLKKAGGGCNDLMYSGHMLVAVLTAMAWMLEKGTGGMSSGLPHDIEIPPPRPKRKPCSSYPQKTGAASQSPFGEVKEKKLSETFVLLGTAKVAMDTKIKEPVKVAIEQNAKQAFGEGTSSASIYFHLNGTSEPLEQMPTLEEQKETRSRITKELRKNDSDLQIFGMSTDSRFGLTTEEKWQVLSHMEMPFTSWKDNLQGGESHENIPARFEGTKYSGGDISKSVSTQLEANADLNLSLDSTRTTIHGTKNSISSIHQAVPSTSPHNPFNNDDNPFSALINLTKYFPSLLVSALSQNPALHQAASIAASSLPPDYVDFFMLGEASEKQSSASSGISAIVTATIAAASAWWRVHGLLPCPFQPNHAFTQVMMQATESAQIPEDNCASKENFSQTHKRKFQQIDYAEQPETNIATQPLELSSSPDTCQSTKSQRSPKSTKCGDVDHVPGKKKHDPSSCDSNTSPSSEVEKDAALNKEEAKGINEQGELEQGPSITREFGDAPGISKSSTEGLKQGSLAFEEIFYRGLLPHCFSPPHLDGNWATNSGNEEASGLSIDLNRKVFAPSTCKIFSENARSSINNGLEVAKFNGHLVETVERNNAGQEESSGK